MKCKPAAWYMLPAALSVTVLTQLTYLQLNEKLAAN